MGDALANPLVVEVRDQFGEPLVGAQVTFAVIGRRWQPRQRIHDRNRYRRIRTEGHESCSRWVRTRGRIRLRASIAELEVETFNAVGVGAPAVPGTGHGYPDAGICRKTRSSAWERAPLAGPTGRSGFLRTGNASPCRAELAFGYTPWTIWTRVALLPSGIVQSLAFSSDGATIASGGQLAGARGGPAVGRG